MRSIRQNVAIISIVMIGLFTSSSCSQDSNSDIKNAPALVSYGKMKFSLSDTGLSEYTTAYDLQQMQGAIELRWVQADGVITAETPRDFEEFLKNDLCAKQQICDLQAEGIKTLGLNSMGGNLAAGLELGRLIRSLGLKTSLTTTETNEDGKAVPIIGTCLSACGYAFLGGVHRRIEFNHVPVTKAYLPSGENLLGVHRFWDGSKAALELKEIEQTPPPTVPKGCDMDDEEARTQCIDAVLIRYINDMGVDVQFFEAATQAGGREFLQLDALSLKRLNVLSDTAFTHWVPASPMELGLVGGSDFQSNNIDPDDDVRYIRASCYSPNRRQLIFGVVENFDDIIGATSDDMPWIFSSKNKSHVVPQEQIYAVVHAGTLTLSFTFDVEDWKSLFQNEPNSLIAYPISEAEKSTARRFRVEAHWDKQAARQLNAFVTECHGRRFN